MTAAALAATLLAPLASSAAMMEGTALRRMPTANAGENGAETKGTVKPGDAFCAALEKRDDAMLNDMKAKLDAARAERDTRVAGREDERERKLADARDLQAARLEAIVAKLTERATTDAQHAAIASFQANMKAALDTRRSAVDVADTTFKSTLEAARNDRKNQVDAAIAAMKAAVQAAFDKAKADCAAGVSAATIRSTMRASIEAARAKFKTAMAAADKVGTAAKAAAEAHRVAIDKAFAAFKAEAEAERKALKAAFPDKPEGKVKSGADVH